MIWLEITESNIYELTIIFESSSNNNKSVKNIFWFNKFTVHKKWLSINSKLYFCHLSKICGLCFCYRLSICISVYLSGIFPVCLVKSFIKQKSIVKDFRNKLFLVIDQSDRSMVTVLEVSPCHYHGHLRFKWYNNTLLSVAFKSWWGLECSLSGTFW